MANPSDSLGQQVGEWAKSGIVVALGGLVSIGPDETLRWEFRAERVEWKNPSEDLLDQFSSLWQKPNRSIVAFASKWGPLRIDEQGQRTVSHQDAGSEPLEWWRYLSRRAYSVQRIADALDHGRIGDDEDWDFLSSAHRGSKVLTQERFGLSDHARLGFGEYQDLIEEIAGHKDPVNYSRGLIAREVSRWLAQFDVGLSLAWDPKTSWQINMSYKGLMIAAVAHQLALAVAHGERVFTCSGSNCGKLYTRPFGRRKPNAGHANFCPVCISKREPQREAERRYRENRREAIRLAASGMKARDIAVKLERSMPVVQRWLKQA